MNGQHNTAESNRIQTDAAQEPARAVLDGDGRFVFATPAFAGLCGGPVDGRAFTQVLIFADPDDAFHAQGLFGQHAGQPVKSLREGAHEVVVGGRTETLHFDRITLPDGRVFMIVSVAAPIEAETDPAFMTMLSALGRPQKQPGSQDVSATSPETNCFLDMSHEVMTVADGTGRLQRVNRTFRSVLGYGDGDISGLSLLDLVHPDDKPVMRNTLAALIHDDGRENEIADCEARLIAADKTVRTIEWRHMRRGDSLYSVGRDLTEFRNTENALRQQETMLREAQSIGHMGHWRWIVGSNDIQWSDEIYKIFGVGRDNFIPALDAVNRMTHKRDVGRLLQAFQRAIIERNNYDMEFRIARPDGEIRHIRCEGRCEKDENGDVTALFGIMQDVTERALNAQHLTEAKDAAERAYAAKTQFLANMSHELRTPLNAIIGFSEMMQRQLLGPIGSERYLDYIAGIRESGEHLLDLISDILDMSKIEAGKYELDLEELHIAKVIRLAVHMMEGRATEGKINISIEIANEDLPVVADRRALMQVLLNILSNAVKFTEPGGSVQIECIERGDYVSVKIHDTGIGIPANQLKNVTRPFEQAASHYTRKHEGTGLGLAITKELVELHGGSLHIESTVGVGTTVTVRLPYNAYEAMKQRRKG